MNEPTKSMRAGDLREGILVNRGGEKYVVTSVDRPILPGQRGRITLTMRRYFLNMPDPPKGRPDQHRVVRGVHETKEFEVFVQTS